MKGARKDETDGPINSAEDLRALQALAEPNRMRIAELLRSGPRTVGEIAQKLGLRQPQASKHLRVLLQSGIVAVTADANRRIYSLRREPFRSLDEWLASFTQTMEQRYDKLDVYLKRVSENDQ